MHIVRANPEDSAVLSAIAVTAKRHWDYPESWIEAWRDALTISAPYLEQHLVYAALIGNEQIGFYGLELEADRALLEHLWVAPKVIRSGVGRALFLHAVQTASATGATRITVEADPHAEGFYLRMGATTVGYAQSRVAGVPRWLPLMEKRIQ